MAMVRVLPRLRRPRRLGPFSPFCAPSPPFCAPFVPHVRCYAAPSKPQDIAIVGGGLTGLATAYYLSALVPPSVRITLYESAAETGGWVDSLEVTDADDTHEILEGGPRMVAPQTRSARFDDLLFLELVDGLGLLDALRVSDHEHAQYIYYPDRLVNMRMTTTLPKLGDGSGDGSGGLGGLAGYGYALVRWAAGVLAELRTQPLFRGILAPLLRTYLLPSGRARARDWQARQVQAAAKSPARLPDDMSVGAFFESVTGSRVVSDRMMGALMHGIYGGDVWRLSVASSPFRAAWLKRGTGGLFRAWSEVALRERVREERLQKNLVSQRDIDDFERTYAPLLAADDPFHPRHFAPLTPEMRSLAQRYTDDAARPALVAMESDLAMLQDLLARKLEDNTASRFARLAEASMHWTTMAFDNRQGGFGALTQALAQRLQTSPNVTLRTGTRVTAIDPAGAQVRVSSTTTSDDSALFDRVVSTLVAPQLYRVTGGRLPALQNEHAVTIQLVNLYYDEPGLHHPYHGFGYLIPSTVPLEQNPEAALGVIFDTDREQAMRPVEETKTETASGSKYTVMFGGHYWDGGDAAAIPDDDEAVRRAESVLHRHLASTDAARRAQDPHAPTSRLGRVAFDERPRPRATRVKVCTECIPQHNVGHATRMADVDCDLRRAYNGRLAVAGGSFTATGPGVLPSIRSAWDMALCVAGRGYQGHGSMYLGGDLRGLAQMAHVGDTGLGRFADPATDTAVPVPKAGLPFRFKNTTRLHAGAWTVQIGGKDVTVLTQSHI